MELKENKYKRREGGRDTRQTQKKTIRMISTRQCSLFTIACPMPDCFPEKGGRKKGNQNNSEQKTVVNKDGEKMKIK